MTKRCGSEQKLTGKEVQEGIQSGDLCMGRGTIPVFLSGPCANRGHVNVTTVYINPQSLSSSPVKRLQPITRR